MKAAIALMVFAAACTTESTSSEEAEVVAKKSNKTVTTIRTHGLFADVVLFDESTNTDGNLTVSRDEIDDTTSISFLYFQPDPTDPAFTLITQGAGQIPNSAFSITTQEAELNLPSFPTIRCRVNGTSTCAPGAPVGFDLVWEANGFRVLEERFRRTERVGPITTKSRGETEIRSAVVTGTWNGASGENMSGNLQDTQQTTITREITIEIN